MFPLHCTCLLRVMAHHWRLQRCYCVIIANRKVETEMFSVMHFHLLELLIEIKGKGYLGPRAVLSVCPRFSAWCLDEISDPRWMTPPSAESVATLFFYMFLPLKSPLSKPSAHLEAFYYILFLFMCRYRTIESLSLVLLPS